MAMTRRRRLAIAAAAAALLALLVPSFTLPWARAAIVRSLAASLGRRVEAGAVHLRLLPLPGFELDNVELGDAPAFGIEPMVVAQQAVANLRWLPLLRGELEFSSVSLDGASINLVRDRQGRWNLPALLRLPASGGAPPRAGASPAVRMPYLAWSDSRVNFKFDATKSRFYLDQVSGSLARESGDWRLQLQFQPARTDENLSDAGEVTVDGRWAPAPSLTQAPFDVAVHIRGSYLAASTALLLGHDAGVHGIVSADVRLRGDGRAIAVSGTAQARSVRRAALLPRPAAIAASFAGRYFPPRDEFTLTGLGDAGWRRLQVAGAVDGLFSHPRVRLTLALRRFPAAGLLPLALAVKSGLPDRLQVQGSLSGQTALGWSPGALPRCRGAFTLDGLALRDRGSRLDLPAGRIVCDASGLRLLPAAARLRRDRRPAATLTLAAALDRSGISLRLASSAIEAQSVDALAALLGLRSPWPAAVAGAARAQWTLLAPWQRLTHPRWSGRGRWTLARFTPPGARGLVLRGLSLRWGARAQAEFVVPAGADRVAGSLRWRPGAAAPVEFALRARRLDAAAVLAQLRPAPRPSLAASLLARVLGHASAAPVWLAGLHGQGRVAVDDFVWHGIHTRLSLQLDAAPGRWQARRLALDLAEGAFFGQGSWTPGAFHITGAVPSDRPLRAATLLAASPDRGVLRGWLWGSITLLRPDTGGGMGEVQAQGTFALVRGALATAAGERRFSRLAGAFTLRDGRATLTHLEWLAAGRRFTGAGTVRFAPNGAASFDLLLHDGRRPLRLRSR
jgi:hypothetical protein